VEATITIRALTRSDASAIVAIQSQCPELAAWSQRDYEEAPEKGIAGWVATMSAPAATAEIQALPIVGFLVARQAADELEILNLAVSPTSRRQGVARTLLANALSWGKENKARQAFLEVRESNSIAIGFYQRHGFKITGRRPKYYATPIEDALHLSAPIA
jgi:[ribosomal protein S18]-alanine N-acetyltransferase